MEKTGPHSRIIEGIDLSKRPIHLNPPINNQVTAEVLEAFNFDGPSFERYIESHCSEEDPGRLIMIEVTPADWTTWERHPLGDEIVIVLSGEGDFIQQIDNQEIRIPVSPGVTVLNPTGVWHTADVRESIRAVYITPCPDTDHKPRT